MTTESQKQEKPVKVVILSKPYTFGEKKIRELRIMREPLAEDLKGLAIGKGLADDQFVLLGRISDLSTSEIHKMSMGDSLLCIQAIEDFLPDSLRTGNIS
jgi:hypothetical protein